MTNLEKLRKLVKNGVAREQCAGCGHEKRYHDKNDVGRRCTVCWDYCVYRPAFVPR